MAYKPIIGICMRVGDNPIHASVDIRYLRRIEEASGIPVALPYGFEAAKTAREALEVLDGLVLTGGGDILPESFGGHPYADSCVAKLSFMSAERDVFEYAAARTAFEMNLPTLGICRGLQVMNVTHGGTLVRDISELGGNKMNHVDFEHQAEVVHNVRVKRGSKLRKILGADTLGVNSLHHLAVCDVAKGAKIVAWADDETPEGLEFPEKDFYLGVQWHPEIIANTPQLFEAFTEAARVYHAAKHF